MADLAGEACRADLHPAVGHDAAADPSAQRDHDDVAVTTCRAQTVLGQHGEVGVVLHHHSATGQLGTDQARPVHTVSVGEVGGVAKAPVAVDHAGSTDPHGCVS